MLPYILLSIMYTVSASVPTTTLRSNQQNCIIGKDGHCTYDEIFAPYNGRNDTDCDCIPDSCDSDANDPNYGSLDSCKTHKDNNDASDDETLTLIAIIVTLLAILAIIYIFRNILCRCCYESDEEYKERQRKNTADRKTINELASERDALLQSTTKLEPGIKINF